MRKFGIVDLADYTNFCAVLFKYYYQNRKFIKENPNFILPSLWRMYEASSTCSYELYFEAGVKRASLIYEIIREHVDDPEICLLEWGCGPGRTIRHLRDFEGLQIREITGIDYNPESIEYCKKSISGINFFTNELLPPTTLERDGFDVIYAISVFTHLSKELHLAWIAEINRLLKPGGLFIGTFHGDNYKHKLLPKERNIFDNGELVVRSGTKEGSHMFSAYHPRQFLEKQLFADFHTIQTIETAFKGYLQAVWVVQKPKH